MNRNAARTNERFTTAMMLLSLAALCFAPGAHAQDAATLRARQTLLREQLADNQFQRPLLLESTQTDGTLKSDVDAVVPHPYSVVGQALQGMDHWCDILILHLNVKSCRARGLDVRRQLDELLREILSVVPQPEKSSHFKTVQSA